VVSPPTCLSHTWVQGRSVGVAGSAVEGAQTLVFLTLSCSILSASSRASRTMHFGSDAVSLLESDDAIEAMLVFDSTSIGALPSMSAGEFREQFAPPKWDDDDDDDAGYFALADRRSPGRRSPGRSPVKKKAKRAIPGIPRETWERIDKTETNWWRQFLAPTRQVMVENGMSPEASGQEKQVEFEWRSQFRVSITLFRDLRQQCLLTGFYDPEKKDATGFKHDLSLLLLGALNCLAHTTTFVTIKLQNGVSRDTNRRFFHRWTAWNNSRKDLFIHLPRTDEGLRVVGQKYFDYGFPGCVGSIDVVKIGWDRCPAGPQALHLRSSLASLGVLFVQLVARLRFVVLLISRRVHNVDNARVKVTKVGQQASVRKPLNRHYLLD